MLLFYCTFETSVKRLASEGLVSEGEPFILHRTLEEAQATCRAPDGRRGHILVLAPSRIAYARVHPPTVHYVAPHAILNLKPYRAPLALEAAGGYVVRRSAKGKLDPGETPENGAIREVSEEVGIKKKSLTLLQPLGVSLHGYILPRKMRFAVKTTHWYAMETTQNEFAPQKKEGIEAVGWMSWKKAKKQHGYESLRQHIAAIDPEALGLAPVETS